MNGPVGKYENVSSFEGSCLPGAVKPGKIVNCVDPTGRGREGHSLLLLDLRWVLSEPASAGDIFSLHVAAPVGLLDKTHHHFSVTGTFV